jgi:hypothetical protein
MHPIALMTLATLLLAGCAGYSPECVTGTGTKECATGTLGNQQLAQEKQGDETLASIDDARCRAIAPPSSGDYLACRRRAAGSRSTNR